MLAITAKTNVLAAPSVAAAWWWNKLIPSFSD